MPTPQRRRGRRRYRRSPSTEERRLYACRKRHRSHGRDSYSDSSSRSGRRSDRQSSRNAARHRRALHNRHERQTHSTNKQRQYHLHDNRKPPGRDRKDEPQGKPQPAMHAIPPLPSPPQSSQVTCPRNAMKTSISDIPTADVTTVVTLEPALSTSAPASALGEAIEDRRWLPRSHMPSGPFMEGDPAPVLRDSEAGVLDNGAPRLPLRPTQPDSLFAQRPPTPALLPRAGVPMSSSSPSPLFSSPSSPKVIPFSHVDYVKWLYTTPPPPPSLATRDAVNTGAKSSSSGVSRHDDERATASAAIAADEVAPLSPSTPPFFISTEVRRAAVPHGDTSAPISPCVGEEDIGYLSDIAVSTDWVAVRAAPRLMPSVPPLPSRFTHPPSAPLRGASVGRNDSSLYSQATSSPLLSEKTPSCDGRPTLCRCGEGDGTVSAASISDAFQQRDDYDADEGLRAFAKHFENGKVHTRPPWFLCSTLLNNCEHPYYVNWLDELDLGSVEEELARAKASQMSVLSEPSSSH